jgi:hypothetical protein
MIAIRGFGFRRRVPEAAIVLKTISVILCRKNAY